MDALDELLDSIENDKNFVRKFFRHHGSFSGKNSWYWLTHPHLFLADSSSPFPG
jgi:hypothetical protein